MKNPKRNSSETLIVKIVEASRNWSSHYQGLFLQENECIEES